MRAGFIRGIDEGADGADRPATLANDEPDVGRMQTDAVAGFVVAGNFADLHVVGIIDETAHDKFEEVFHRNFCARVL